MLIFGGSQTQSMQIFDLLRQKFIEFLTVFGTPKFLLKILEVEENRSLQTLCGCGV